MSDIAWAVRQMQGGNRVRRQDWGLNECIWLTGSFLEASEGRSPTLSGPSLVAMDWEVYEEPPLVPISHESLEVRRFISITPAEVLDLMTLASQVEDRTLVEQATLDRLARALEQRA